MSRNANSDNVEVMEQEC